METFENPMNFSSFPLNFQQASGRIITFKWTCVKTSKKTHQQSNMSHKYWRKDTTDIQYVNNTLTNGVLYNTISESCFGSSPRIIVMPLNSKQPSVWRRPMCCLWGKWVGLRASDPVTRGSMQPDFRSQNFRIAPTFVLKFFALFVTRHISLP